MASSQEQGRPHLDDNGWPSTSANSFRQQYLAPGRHAAAHTAGNEPHSEIDASAAAVDAPIPSNEVPFSFNTVFQESPMTDEGNVSSEDRTAVPSPAESEPVAEARAVTAISSDETSRTSSEKELEENEKKDEVGGFAPIKTNTSNESSYRPGTVQNDSSGRMREDNLFKALSRRKTNASGRQGSLMTQDAASEAHEEQAEIERLMSRMFGKGRQQQSEDEKTRHVGLIFKNLTVKGMGLGAALQPTLSGPFLTLPRMLMALFSGKRMSGKPPVRTILNDFTGCVRPGEMLLVLGRPGAGCSTFLKVLANQRFGYETVDGEVTYGGADAKTMAKQYVISAFFYTQIQAYFGV